jgi:hypothetical protein
MLRMGLQPAQPDGVTYQYIGEKGVVYMQSFIVVKD